MSSPFFTASQYIQYWFRATGPHGLHSPFLFDLYNRVIKPSRKCLLEIEKIRKSLRQNNELIDVVDFKSGRVKRSTVGNVARTSLSQPKFSNFLRLLCDYLEVNIVLETGTSLGINSLYLAHSSSVKKVITIEGSDIISRLAHKTLQDQPKVRIVSGNVHEHFEKQLVQHQPDLVFIDADHRGSVIKDALEKTLAHSPSVKCIVLHDIYWSPDMMEAWTEITEDPAYTLTADIFQAGLIFPNYPIEKQHFTLKF